MSLSVWFEPKDSLKCISAPVPSSCSIPTRHADTSTQSDCEKTAVEMRNVERDVPPMEEWGGENIKEAVEVLKGMLERRMIRGI